MRTLLRLGPVLLIAATGAALVTPHQPGPRPVRVKEGAGVQVTVEPTLPLGLDVRVIPLPSLPRSRGAQAILEVQVDAGAELRDVTIRLVLPDGVRAMDDPLPLQAFGLAPGAGRKYVTQVSVARSGRFPIQVEASYRIGDGEPIRTRQGATLRSGEAAGGRSHLGAYEVMAVPLEEWRR